MRRDTVLPKSAVPDFEPPPLAVREHIVDWFRRHEQEYAIVWDRLDQIRTLWGRLDRREKVAYLQASGIFAIYTILTNTPLAEAAYDDLMAGESIRRTLTKRRNIPGEMAGKQNQKPDWIYTSLTANDLWDPAVDLLDGGKIDAAHKLMVDKSKGLGAVKAGFTLAQLGFTQKMCIDGNLARLFKGHQPTTVDIQKYEGLCMEIVDAFPELAEELEPYHIQWVLFDWQRTFRSGEGKAQQTGDPVDQVATHDEWFKHALGDPTRITRRMEQLTRTAISKGYGNVPPWVAEQVRRRETGVMEPDIPPEVFEDIDTAIERAIRNT